MTIYDPLLLSKKKKHFLKLTSFRAPVVFLANKMDFKLFKTKNKRDWEGFLWFKNNLKELKRLFLV